MTNDIQVIEQQATQEITTIQTGLLGLKDSVEKMQITNAQELAGSSDMLKKIKQWIKTIEEKRKFLVKPLNDHVDRINAEFKPQTVFAKEIEGILSGKMVKYQEEERRRLEAEERLRREEEAKRLAEQQKKIEDLAAKTNSEAILEQAIEVEQKQIDLVAKPIEVKQTVVTQNSQTAIRYIWSYEIIDEKSVPRDLCSPDAGKIREKMMSMSEDEREKSPPAGIRFFKKASVVTR